MYTAYLRGLAYIKLGQGKEAAKEFQKIIDHRGVVLNFPLASLAHLELARSYRLNGELEKSRAAYKQFFTLWKHADSEILILQQVKSELIPTGGSA